MRVDFAKVNGLACYQIREYVVKSILVGPVRVSFKQDQVAATNHGYRYELKGSLCATEHSQSKHCIFNNF